MDQNVNSNQACQIVLEHPQPWYILIIQTIQNAMQVTLIISLLEFTAGGDQYLQPVLRHAMYTSVIHWVHTQNRLKSTQSVALLYYIEHHILTSAAFI